jgi:hypothetical protein
MQAKSTHIINFIDILIELSEVTAGLGKLQSCQNVTGLTLLGMTHRVSGDNMM